MNELIEGTKMQDKIERYGSGSVIQHGSSNDRVYLIKMKKADFPGIIDHVNTLAKENFYTKIFCKVPYWASPAFISDGYITEAHIPGFYNKKDDVFFMSKFLNSDRIMKFEHEKLEELTDHLLDVPLNKEPVKLKPEFRLKNFLKEKAEEICELYKKVFDSYPFPIFDPDFIRKTMDDNVQYYGILKKEKLIALASADVDMEGKNAEMTDFATLPAFRGNNLSVILLSEMEKEMKKQEVNTLYTIARLNSTAMNKTFLKLKYRYAGTLIKNTNIAGKIESMNVYYKHI